MWVFISIFLYDSHVLSTLLEDSYTIYYVWIIPYKSIFRLYIYIYIYIYIWQMNINITIDHNYQKGELYIKMIPEIKCF